MSKREARLLAAACLFAGVAIGFLLAPIKAGLSVSCGNNNTVGEPKKRGGFFGRSPERPEQDEPEDPCEF